VHGGKRSAGRTVIREEQEVGRVRLLADKVEHRLVARPQRAAERVCAKSTSTLLTHVQESDSINGCK